MQDIRKSTLKNKSIHSAHLKWIIISALHELELQNKAGSRSLQAMRLPSLVMSVLIMLYKLQGT